MHEEEQLSSSRNGRDRLIVFDIDGTLVDSQDDIVEAQSIAFAALGRPPPGREAALSVVGLSLREAFARLVGEVSQVDALVAAYKAAWAEIRRRPGFSDRLYPGAAETIDALASSDMTRLGIATGKSRAGVARILAAQGWERVFTTVQTADTHPSKPDPSMVEAALDEAGVSPERTIVVGDTTFDMLMARRAGATAIGVAWGYHSTSALLTAGAAAIADDFAQLRSLLDRHGTAD